ncbi:MAG: hypothetical protein J5642_07545 [Bacteroidales bacterium]|nr:hypothetical protein [Bacteroidales bacterium]
MENTENKQVRSRFWLGFSIGLMAGLVFAVVFYFVDKSLNDPVQLLVTAPVAAEQPTEETIEEGDSPDVGRKIPSPTYKSLVTSSADSSVVMRDSLLADVDFSLDEAAGEDNATKGSACGYRAIPVKSLEAGVQPPLAQLEVEQWTEYVNNRISYQRTGAFLKIKGLSLQNLRVFYVRDSYYLENNGKYYAIPENSDFHRLQEVEFPND